ncbi:endonuclease/exonuclease/phosphatase family protein [Carboxylicivirga marina]|uniref:endonuclease/exonuclease/phosphatase family protein n=1 Tax=Carboxylicivirga marina TaxID=2800988 RepID=UPI00259182D7|nr:endonuclease/exonuclease/phosphatase family protein [uncultured Carboxylicivirga sp.]
MRKIAVAIVCLGISVFYACNLKQTSNIKVMSYNIKHGYGMDNVLDLNRAAEIIKVQAPDLCGLQEIDNYCRRSDSVAQTEYIAQFLNMTGTFVKFMDFQGGEYGMATLSSRPLVSTKILTLPDGLDEPRSAIVQEVQIAEACTLLFVNVHFDYVDGNEGVASRLNQAKALMEYINSIDKAAIITGDFNCEPRSSTMQYFYDQGFEFVHKGEDNLSYQGDTKLEIDHVIYRHTSKVEIRAKSIRLLDEPIVSDHRPLIAELEVVY